MPKNQTLKPRKIPKQKRSQETVERILKAATHILATEGPSAFNTNAIAAIADISIGSLYQYFPDKETMIAMLIRQHNLAFLSELEAFMVNISSFEGRVKALIRVAVKQQLSSPQLARFLDQEEARLPLDQETRALQSNIVALVVRLLDEAGYDDSQMLAQDVMAIARGMIDKAGMMAEENVQGLERRVCHAVFGYLQQSHDAQGEK